MTRSLTVNHAESVAKAKGSSAETIRGGMSAVDLRKTLYRNSESKKSRCLRLRIFLAARTSSGTAANLSCGLYTAGKTGTTSSNYDAWFCGYTPYYTASIWIGFDVNTNFAAGSYHKNMWRKIMDAIVEAKGLDTSKTFEIPSGIIRATVFKDT